MCRGVEHRHGCSDPSLPAENWLRKEGRGICHRGRPGSAWQGGTRPAKKAGGSPESEALPTGAGSAENRVQWSCSFRARETQRPHPAALTQGLFCKSAAHLLEPARSARRLQLVALGVLVPLPWPLVASRGLPSSSSLYPSRYP